MDALATGEYVWIGIPAIRLLPGTVVGRFNAPDNEKTAQGATVWIGRNRDALRLGGPATATRRNLTFGGCRPSVAKICARG